MDKKRSSAKPTARTTVRDLGNMALLDTLGGSKLVVYLRLVASSTATPTNGELWANPRVAAAAIRSLQEEGLISVTYDGPHKRTIEVL
jgi:hypothetical protein